QNRDDYQFFRDRIKLDASKVRFVRGSGVNTDEFVFSKKPSASGQQLTFLMACRLLKEKGVFQYISAARKIKALYPGVQFWLLGMKAKNPSSIHIEELQRFDEEGTIKLLAQTDNVNGLLERADVLVLPSFYNEGVPRILLEGLSKGMPLITTNSVGCRETVADGQNGYMIAPKSTEALEEALLKMIQLSVEEREAMRAESRRLAETEFDENKVIESYIDIIRDSIPVVDTFAIKPLGAR
ncbi:MAG: glycosyltransferase, partial [Chitinophagaceae bacterium]